MDNSDVYGWHIVLAMGKSDGTRGTIRPAFVDGKTLKEIKNKIVTRLIGTELQACKATAIIQELDGSNLPARRARLCGPYRNE